MDRSTALAYDDLAGRLPVLARNQQDNDANGAFLPHRQHFGGAMFLSGGHGGSRTVLRNRRGGGQAGDPSGSKGKAQGVHGPACNRIPLNGK
jgi:hypothetical protein